MLGSVWSMLIAPTVDEAVFPASSVQVPVTDWDVPSVLSMLGLDEELIPERASVQVKLTVTGPLFQPFELGPGLLEPETVGGVRSMLIPVTVVDAEFPALSVQLPVADWLGPSLVKVDGPERDDTPDRESEQEKLMVTGPLFQPLVLALGDLEAVMAGGVRSMLIDPTVIEAEFPALSVHVPVADWAEPSELIVLGTDTEATPESESEQVKLTVTGELFQPKELAFGVLEPAIFGGVKSMLMPPTVVDAVLPALSVQLPVTDWAAPSPVRVDGAVVEPTPDRVSEQVKLTVTGPLFQPLTLGTGLADPVTLGRVLSILTVTETELDVPAPLVAVQVIVVPGVSLVRVVVPHPEEDSIPDSGSETLQVTVTLPLFQPLELGLGLMLGVMAGAVVSTVNLKK